MTSRTRHSTLCVRPECRRPFSEHANEECPNGSGKRFRKHVRTKGASHSFLPDEVAVLRTALLEMGDTELAAQPAFPRAMRKVKTMTKRLEASEQRQEQCG